MVRVLEPSSPPFKGRSLCRVAFCVEMRYIMFINKVTIVDIAPKSSEEGP